ncbi:hypothetical protein GZ998_10895 [Actinomyces sp. 594]|uniref:hypothetical protein n=1 Tax=Actinomyces sp. 594 TaxID=2057793 RepID=UPI001C564B16|nr:hypothetical protein [Actinomyces sp. 594]MBW3070003.1 hypothetical protein [Actinomyces sp. 594]
MTLTTCPSLRPSTLNSSSPPAPSTGDQLWLIEAKDYAYQEAKEPKNLVAVVAEKVTDTLAGMHAGTRDGHTDREMRQMCRKAVRARKLYVAPRIDLPGAQPHAGRGRQAAAQQTMANYRQQLDRSLRRVVNGKVHVITGRENPPTVPWTAGWNEAGRRAHRQM